MSSASALYPGGLRTPAESRIFVDWNELWGFVFLLQYRPLFGAVGVNSSAVNSMAGFPGAASLRSSHRAVRIMKN